MYISLPVDGGDGGAITAERIGCQFMFEMTTTSVCVELVGIFNVVSIILSVKLLNIFIEMLGHFPVMFVAAKLDPKPDIVDETSGHFVTTKTGIWS